MASTPHLRRAALVAVAAASVFLLSACAPSHGTASDYPGLPAVEQGSDGPAPEENIDGTPQAVWLEQGGRVAITLWGSSTCPPIGSRIDVISPQGEGNTVSIEVPDLPADAVCTMDFVPHTTEFWTPMNVTTTEPLTIQVLDQEIVLPIK